MRHLLAWGRRHFVALGLSFAMVIFAMFYFPEFRGYLSTHVTAPLATALLGSSWFSSLTRPAMEWALTGLEVFGLSLVLMYVLVRMHQARPAHATAAPLAADDMARHRHRRHVELWIFAGAISSFVFAFAGFAIAILAYYFQAIPFWLLQDIAYKYWPVACVLEVLLQTIPMNTRQATANWDVVVDQWTSFLPITGWICLLVAMGFGRFGLGTEGLWLYVEWFGVAAIELELLAVGNRMIAANRGEARLP